MDCCAAHNALTGRGGPTHDLRHHCASVLISSGVSIKSVQRYLDHKNASETLDTDGHLMPGDDDRLRSVIDVALRGNVHGLCTEPFEDAVL
jgi:integrase